MVDPPHHEVGRLRQGKRREETLRIVPVAPLWIVGQRHPLVPDLGNDRVYTDATGIAKTCAAHCRLIRDAIHGYRNRIQVVGDNLPRAVRNLNDSSAQQRCRYPPVDGADVRKTSTFVVEEEIGLAPPERRVSGPPSDAPNRFW